MPNNFLVTGDPRSGKTTVIQRTVEALRDRGFTPGGIYCPERRVDGERVGFDIVDVETGDGALLAHVDRESGPQVGSYRVDVAAVDAVSESVFPRALSRADFVVVDEIAPMELFSESFVRHVREALDDPKPVLAAIHGASTSGFIGEVKARSDVERFEVTPATRDDLPAQLVAAVTSVLSR